MTKTTTLCGLLIALVAMAMLVGCKDDSKRKAMAEAAQARAELVKAKAEAASLKGELSYLKEKLQTASQAQDKLQKQSTELIEDKEAVTTDVQDAQQEIDNLKALLAEQTKKATELGKQVEQLKAVIREFQMRIEPNKPPEQPKAQEQTQTTG